MTGEGPPHPVLRTDLSHQGRGEKRAPSLVEWPSRFPLKKPRKRAVFVPSPRRGRRTGWGGSM